MSVDVTPELILPYLMGIWGSAMAAGILEGIRQEVLPKGLQFNAQLPFMSDILEFTQKDYPALYALATILTKHDVDKKDIRETLRYTIKYLDKAIFTDMTKIDDLERIKLRLKETERRLSEIKIYDQEVELDELSWLYDEIKPIAELAVNSQPDRVSILSDKLVKAKKISELQAFSGAKLGNPYYQLDFDDNLLFDQASIELRDGGVDFNIPFPPLLPETRATDIIIAFDASPDTGDKIKALENGCRYAKRHNYTNFPAQACLELFSNPTKLKKLITESYTIIGDPDSLDTMTIIYIPLKILNNNKYNPHTDITSTMNLRYTPQQVDDLAGFSEGLANIAAPAIRDIFKKKLRQRMLKSQP
jgi:hypothetical protein